jgi:tetratricopeptide (TPR) repeat protein
VLEVRQRVRGEQHPETLTAMNNLGRLYGDHGEYAGAEALLSKAVDGRRRELGQQHISTLVSMHTLAIILRDEGKYEQAEAIHTKELEIARRVLGGDHRETLSSASDLGRLYLSQGRYAAAESLLGKVVEAERRVLGPGDIGTTKGLASLGEARLFEQKYPEAELSLREALGNYEKLNSGIWGRYDTQSLLGASLAGQRRYADAEPLLLAGYAGLLQRQNAIPADTRPVVEEARERIVHLYQDWGKPEKAAAWREKVQAGKAESR